MILFFVARVNFGVDKRRRMVYNNNSKTKEKKNK